MGKRREICILKLTIEGVDVDAKKCSICGLLQPLESFHKSQQGLGGKASRCKQCASKYAEKYRKTDKKHNKVFEECGEKFKKCTRCGEIKSLDAYSIRKSGSVSSRCKVCNNEMNRKNTGPKPIPIIQVSGDRCKECRTCGKIKPLTSFIKSVRGNGGTRASCKPCEAEKRKTYHYQNRDKRLAACKRWRLENPEKQRESHRRWAAKNPHKDGVYRSNRKARQRLLPNTLTPSEWESTLKEFNYSCALTGSADITMDHFIPISSGVGGTTKENVYPLCKKLNFSKWNRNPFTWFVKYGKDHAVEECRWLGLISWLASKNGMSVSDYENYVKSAFVKGDDDE